MPLHIFTSENVKCITIAASQKAEKMTLWSPTYLHSIWQRIGVSGLQEILKGDSGEVFQETLGHQCAQWHRG